MGMLLTLLTAAAAPDEAPAGETAMLLLLLLLLPLRKGTLSRSWGRSWPPFMAPRRAAIVGVVWVSICASASMCQGASAVRLWRGPGRLTIRLIRRCMWLVV